jgi:hypothetical protein
VAVENWLWRTGIIQCNMACLPAVLPLVLQADFFVELPNSSHTRTAAAPASSQTNCTAAYPGNV